MRKKNIFAMHAVLLTALLFADGACSVSVRSRDLHHARRFAVCVYMYTSRMQFMHVGGHTHMVS